MSSEWFRRPAWKTFDVLLFVGMVSSQWGHIPVFVLFFLFSQFYFHYSGSVRVFHLPSRLEYSDEHHLYEFGLGTVGNSGKSGAVRLKNSPYFKNNFGSTSDDLEFVDCMTT